MQDIQLALQKAQQRKKQLQQILQKVRGLYGKLVQINNTMHELSEKITR